MSSPSPPQAQVSDRARESPAQAAGRAPIVDMPAQREEPELDLALSTAADRPEQGRLYDLCFAKSDGERVLPWRYDGSPHGAAIVPIARDAAGALVSSYACQPRRVLHRGQVVGASTVGQTGDVMTHPELRSRGIFSELHWAALEAARARGWSAAWGLPNRHSGRIFFGKLRWKLAGHIGPWTFVLASDARARAVRLTSGRAAALGTSWAAWRGEVCRARMRRRARGLTIERLERFPVAVEELTRAVAARHGWMVERDADFLNWRFLDAPSGRFSALAVRDGSGALVAYAVAQSPDPQTGMGAVPDLVGIDTTAEDAALEAALGALGAQGAAIVRAYGMLGSPWEAILARGGFRPPRGRKEVGAFALDRDDPLGAGTLDTSSWYFTDGDRDDELVR